MALIDKDEAVDLVRKMQTYKLSADANFLLVDQAEVMTELMLLPPAKPKWIPCSERLPRVREWVLCQCRAGIMDVLRLTEDGDWNKNYPHAEYMSGFVIAWMPLPEPYKGEVVK